MVAISIGFSMIQLVAPTFFTKLPSQLGPISNLGILLTAISAVALNLYFNGASSIAKAPREAQGALQRRANPIAMHRNRPPGR